MRFNVSERNNILPNIILYIIRIYNFMEIFFLSHDVFRTFREISSYSRLYKYNLHSNHNIPNQ